MSCDAFGETLQGFLSVACRVVSVGHHVNYTNHPNHPNGD
jgi:hypothetical protein